MKVYIQTDIEGVAGYCFFENRNDTSMENFSHRQRMRRLLTDEVNAAVRAAFEAGADDVLVNDSHGSGYNILFEELDERCRIIHGRNCSGPHWLPLLEGSDALVLVGMHAMGGTPQAITPHSLWEVNGGTLFLSEGTMAAAIAGEMGIPAVFVSGDQKITSEFKTKIPDIAVAVVKQALSPYQACSVTPARSCAMIREGVLDGLHKRSAIKPFCIKGPIKLALLDSDNHAPPFSYPVPPVEAASVNEAFMKYEKAMKWTCFDLQEPDGFVFP